eukprot:CAMPEP_0180441130 /NCGR_PEP_ID=MMETSP1036_2-20121128/13467_1 /TAXON_ID=632150 /ORGANISM="Azadinium spinosum, Strain 3D9" /LENGTH=35 /DNA_ID= /DNA_START= /DNA_END= /DNA_ORIENTATION=
MAIDAQSLYERAVHHIMVAVLIRVVPDEGNHNAED